MEVYGITMEINHFLNISGTAVDFFADNNNSASLKFATKIADRIRNNAIKNVKIRVPLKYLSKF